MSTLLDRRRRPARRRLIVRQPGRISECPTAGAAASLEDAILDAWEGLAAHRSVDCLVCGAAMAPRYGASGHAPVGGRCAGCGTSLG